MKKIGIMQPYFFPYIGYFQLINSVDEFVIYDNIQYTKKGWINRNRILLNNNDSLITLPITKASDYLDIVDRRISPDWFSTKRSKMLNQISHSYKKSPMFEEVFNIVEDCINFDNDNLFDFIHFSLRKIVGYLDIDTKITISSSINIDHSLKSKYKIFDICDKLNGDIYINAIGGTTLYDKTDFELNSVPLRFLKTNPIKYEQFGGDFIPYLSIIDVLMFNDKELVKKYLNEYTLI